AVDSDKLFATYLVPTEDESDSEMLANLYMVRSEDGGKTFLDPVQVNGNDGEASDGGYVVPARFGSNDEVYVLWEYVEPHPQFWGIGELRLAKSTDGGRTFGSTVDPAANEPLSEKYYGELAVSNSGTIMAAYINNEFVTLDSSNGTQIVYNTDSVDYVIQMILLRSDDGGKTFDKVVLDEDACQCCDNVSTVGPDGEIYYAWRSSDRDVAQKNDFSDKYISTYGNRTKGQEYEWSDDAGKAAYDQGLIDFPTEYSTARDIVVAHTTDGGKGLKWSEPVRVQEKMWMYNGCPSIGAGMQFDSTGRLHVTYFTGAGADGKIGYYHVYSDDKGKTFSEPKPVFSADFIADTHTNTDLTIDKNDNLWVSFVTFEEAGSTESDWEKLHEMGKTLHVYVIDRQGNIIDNEAFSSGSISSPSSASTKEGTFISYSDDEGAKIVSLALGA
ncbi:MAG: sialidase family protein, partial [Nitrososphaera sp.]